MPQLRRYTIKVKHDRGTAKFTTAARSERAARAIVMAAERCPACAIIAIKPGEYIGW